MAGHGITEVNDATFEQEVLKSDEPVLVDFWAAWCGPCRALAPIVDEVAAAYEGKLKVMKMDVDRNASTRPDTAFAASPRCCSLRVARWRSRSSATCRRRRSIRASRRCWPLLWRKV